MGIKDPCCEYFVLISVRFLPVSLVAAVCKPGSGIDTTDGGCQTAGNCPCKRESDVSLYYVLNEC